MLDALATAWESIPNALPDGSVRSNRELIDEFERHAKKKDAKTKEKYRLALEEFAEHLDGPLVDARPRQIQDYVHYLEHERPDRAEVRDEKTNVILVRRRRGLLGPSSIKCQRAAIREFYKRTQCVTTSSATLPSASRCIVLKKGLTIGRELIMRFLNADADPNSEAEGGHRCRIQAFLLVYTAGRASVFRYLLWNDIDLIEGTVHFTQGKARTRLHAPAPPRPSPRAHEMAARTARVRELTTGDGSRPREPGNRFRTHDLPRQPTLPLDPRQAGQMAGRSGRYPPPPRRRKGWQGEHQPALPACASNAAG